MGSYCERETVPFGTSQKIQEDFLKPERIFCRRYPTRFFEVYLSWN